MLPDLYTVLARKAREDHVRSNPRPFPGTIETSSIETIDNDRAGLLLGAVTL